jgi:hypothetical protein
MSRQGPPSLAKAGQSDALGCPPAVAEAQASAAAGVVVLGMGRSGTSAVTRMFAKAGFFAGRPDELIGAAESNPTGHWESLRLYRRNEAILKRLDGSWFDPPSERAQLQAADWARPLLRGELERLREQADGAPLAVKDPRIGVLMALWGPLVRDCLHPVLVVRDPIEIALSLARRDGTPPPFALAAWELHSSRVLAHLRGTTVTVARYPSILEDPDLPQATLEAAAGHLSSDLREHLRPQSAGEALVGSLRRNRALAGHHEEHLTGRQRELWRLLDSLPNGSQLLQAPPELCEPSDAARAGVRHETERLRAERERAELTRGLASGSQRVSQVERELLSARRQCGELRQQLARERAEFAGESLIRSEHWLEAVQASTSWRLTRPLRALKRALRPRRSQAEA